MKQLPLAPPRCTRSIAVLAVFFAAEPAEAISDVVKFSGRVCQTERTVEVSFGQRLWTYLT